MMKHMQLRILFVAFQIQLFGMEGDFEKQIANITQKFHFNITANLPILRHVPSKLDAELLNYLEEHRMVEYVFNLKNEPPKVVPSAYEKEVALQIGRCPLCFTKFTNCCKKNGKMCRNRHNAERHYNNKSCYSNKGEKRKLVKARAKKKVAKKINESLIAEKK